MKRFLLAWWISWGIIAYPQVAFGNIPGAIGLGLGRGTMNTTAYTAHSTQMAGDGQAYMTRTAGLTGAADGKQGIFSCWFQPTGLDSTTQEIFLCNTTRFAFYRNNSNHFELEVTNAAGTEVVKLFSTTTDNVAGGRKHVICSWNNTASGGYAKMFVNGVDVTNQSIFLANDTLCDYTDTNWGCGDYPGGLNPIQGSLGEVYFNIATSVDLTVPANLALFYSGGKAVNLGATGSTPTGSQPIVYFKNVFSSFTTNSGSGGDFVKQGTTAFTDGGDFL